MRATLVALAAFVVLPAAAGEDRRYAIEPDQVLLSYRVGLGARQQLNGVSRGLDGAVEMLPGQRVRVRLHVPVASFEAGSALETELLRRTLDVDRFPTVDFEGTAAGQDGREGTLRFEGALSVHGVARDVVVPARVVRQGESVFAHVSFPLDLASFGIELPLVRALAVASRVDVELDVRLHAVREVASR